MGYTGRAGEAYAHAGRDVRLATSASPHAMVNRAYAFCICINLSCTSSEGAWCTQVPDVPSAREAVGTPALPGPALCTV